MTTQKRSYESPVCETVLLAPVSRMLQSTSYAPKATIKDLNDYESL
jgi:hypothetical protein